MSVSRPAGLRPDGTDRYARHRAITGFSQQALADSRILVVGAGAIGNEVVKNLALLGVGRIDVLDLDTVELHNLTRSVLLREADVGQPKAECVARRAAALDPAIRVRGLVGDLRDLVDVETLRDCTMVIAALDNFEARIRLNQLCWLAGTPWVDTAIDSARASVAVYPFDAAGPVACYECGLPASVYQRIAERYACGGLQRAALARQVMPTTIITAAMAAARAVTIALAHAFGDRGAGTAPGASRWMIDTGSGLASTARLAPNPHCPGCAELPRRARLRRVAAGAAAVVAAARDALAEAGGQGAVRLADPMVWRLQCLNCGPTATTRAAELQPARRISDRITRCTQCDQDMVQVEIRDLVDLDDLEQRYREAASEAARDGTGAPRVAQRQLIVGDYCIQIGEPPR